MTWLGATWQGIQTGPRKSMLVRDLNGVMRDLKENSYFIGVWG
jgi:hypothetical protein